MTRTPFLPDYTISLAAAPAATAWLNAFLAAGDEPERPLLCKTLALEWYDGRGIQLIGCDGSLLFRTWCGVEREDDDGKTEPYPWPEREEDPDLSLVVTDAAGFAKGWMTNLLRLSKDAESVERLELGFVRRPDDEQKVLGDAFAQYLLTLKACGQRLELPLLGGTYPAWRALKLGFDVAEYVESITIAPRMFKTLGAIKGASAIAVEFHSDETFIDFRAGMRGMPDIVRGLVMPMRKEVKDDAPPAKRDATQLSHDDGEEDTSTVTITSGGKSVTMTAGQLKRAGRNAERAMASRG